MGRLNRHLWIGDKILINETPEPMVKGCQKSG